MTASEKEYLECISKHRASGLMKGVLKWREEFGDEAALQGLAWRLGAAMSDIERLKIELRDIKAMLHN
jgi:hypothetical protein